MSSVEFKHWLQEWQKVCTALEKKNYSLPYRFLIFAHTLMPQIIKPLFHMRKYMQKNLLFK